MAELMFGNASIVQQWQMEHMCKGKLHKIERNREDM
jgi:hypothetical protein